MSTEEPVESSDEEAEESDADEQSMETIPLFDKAKLEESCIMVDSNELRFISCHPAKYKSYKVSLSLSLPPFDSSLTAVE